MELLTGPNLFGAVGVFKTEKHNIYWSGDGGYGAHFEEIGKRFGPFDWGFMECGQYNERWHAIHMYPEETAQASIDAQVKQAIAVHWAGFALALHHWQDPIERFVASANEKGQEIITPKIGEIIRMDEDKDYDPWWDLS